LIGYAFAALVIYLLAQSTVVLATGHNQALTSGHARATMKITKLDILLSSADPAGRIRDVVRTTIDEGLADARRRLIRLDPAGALRAMRSGAALIDIRSESQIARDGTIAGALVIPRNVLEWRLDPASRHRQPNAPQLDDQVILSCDEGCQSSLAAAALQQLGFARATDVVGGFQAWRAAALPIEQSRTCE